MKQYHDQLKDILANGDTKGDRTGTGTISLFGPQDRYNLRDGFPAVTTKRLAWKAVVSELLWFLEGSTDERRLAEILHGSRDISNTTIWTANADNQGVALGYTNNDRSKELGPIYGKQWRSWGADIFCGGPHLDQITWLINALQKDPDSRRHILSAWNVGDIPDMSLPPCHVMTQFYVNSKNELSSKMYQRSADMFLGVPFNIASYALLTHIIAQLTGLKVGDFVHTMGDAHIYSNHVDQVKEQLSRELRPLPTLIMPEFETLDQLLTLSVNDFKLDGYDPHPTIKAPMAV
jgi:thymidylate synthase